MRYLTQQKHFHVSLQVSESKNNSATILTISKSQFNLYKRYY